MNRRNYGDSLVNLVGLQKQLLPKNPATPALVGCQSWEVQEIDSTNNYMKENISSFKNSIRKAPKIAEKGGEGAEIKVKLELKLLADVALVGYPSVGKSSFIGKFLGNEDTFKVMLNALLKKI